MRLPTKQVVLLVLILAGCGREQAQQSGQWEYESFDKKYSTWHKDERGVWWHPVVIVNWHKETWIEIERSQTNACYDPDDILQVAGEQGWEFAGFDGDKYLLKRRKIKDRRDMISITIMKAELQPAPPTSQWE